MASNPTPRNVTQKYRLDSKPYADKVRRTRKQADRALSGHGEPTMSLARLRATLDRELPVVSLTELILTERDSGW